jgi:RimJ/RimL family protein N-acetyltransferase
LSAPTICAIARIETSRLVMRGWREEDLDSYAAMVADAEVTRFVGGGDDTCRCVAGHGGAADHWALRGYGTSAVERKSDGELVGRIGPLDPKLGRVWR